MSTLKNIKEYKNRKLFFIIIKLHCVFLIGLYKSNIKCNQTNQYLIKLEMSTINNITL